MHTDKHRYLSVFIGVYLWLDFQNMNSKSYDFRQITLNTSLRVERSNRRVLVIASLSTLLLPETLREREDFAYAMTVIKRR